MRLTPLSYSDARPLDLEPVFPNPYQTPDALSHLLEELDVVLSLGHVRGDGDSPRTQLGG